jgi:predicted ester cyclase
LPGRITEQNGSRSQQGPRPALDRGEFQGVAPTERRVKWSGVDLLAIAGGKIIEARFLDDSMGLMRQLRDR